MRDAVRAALHDTADIGLRYGPDDSHLFRFVLQRVTTANPPAPSVLDMLEEALIAAAPLDNAGWAKLIVDNLIIPTAITQTPTAAQDPAMGDYVRATLEMLDGVQTALCSDDNLRNLVLAQWNKALAPQNVWTALSPAVAQVIATLPTSRTLRSRYLLANMGGVAQLPPRQGAPATPEDRSVPIWKALTTTRTGPGTTYATEQQDLTDSLKNLLAAYFQGRFGNASADPNSTFFANRAPSTSWPLKHGLPVPYLTTALKDDAGQFAWSVLFPTTPTRLARRRCDRVLASCIVCCYPVKQK